MADRAVTPVVGKALEASIVVLFIGLVTTALYGGLVPEYRDAVGAEVGDRTLVAAAERVEAAVPPNATRVETEHEVDLPRTIRGAAYRIRANDSTLALDHPDPAVSGRTRLVLPSSVASVSGAWSSGGEAIVAVRTDPEGLAIELEEGE
ncbi:DUF7266 family protein [Halegenticoccus tardaugens]|uniref:DUF7266 family protein n=1 Tax=Halegenticoccus tardaugens TaxID=2071624 RepID=UPI00100A9364|nr:hypothetical protein [Halegenticoccus tardaugens]